MANSFGSVTERLAPMVKEALRNRPGAFRWIQTDFAVTPASRGDTIPSQFPAAMTTRDVVPGPYSVAPTALAPTKVDLVVNQWRESPFALTYQESLTVTDEYLQQQANQAVEALTSYMEATIFSVISSGSVQTISSAWSTTPYANINSGTCLLDRALAPETDRTFLFNTNVKNKILDYNASKVGTLDLGNTVRDAVRDGNLGRIAGDCRMHWSHVVPAGQNALIHRGAVGMVVRAAVGPDDIIVTDPVTGMPLVLREKDEHYQRYISISALWGVIRLRPTHVVLFSSDV